MENNKEQRPFTESVNNKSSTLVTDWYNRNPEEDNNLYPQRGNAYRMMAEEQKQELIKNIVHEINNIEAGPEREMTVNLQLCHWFRIDIGLGIAVAKELDIDLGEMMKQMPQTV